MGNDIETIPNRFKNAYNPNMTNWVIISKQNKVNLWQNKQTKELLEEYSYTATDKAQLYRLRSHFEHRFNKPYIVASKFFKERQTDELCSSFYQVSMFIESIGLRLTQFRDVVYPDCLHLYNACLHGFGQLQARLGFFDVSDNLVGINKHGQVKVWSNPIFSKQRPVLAATKDGQAHMLKQVIELVNASMDTRTEPESIKIYLNQNAKSFQQAVAALKQFAARHQVEIPTCLQTVNHLRQKGLLEVGPFIKPETKSTQPPPSPHFGSNLAQHNTVILNGHSGAHPQHIQVEEQSKYPISSLHAEALKQFPLPVQKSPSAIITPNPKITSVMYHPIDFGGNPVAPPFPRQNVIVNTDKRKNFQQTSPIHNNNNFQNQSNNIKQSEIISEAIPSIYQQEQVLLVNNTRPKNLEQRPIYLSTPAFVQRQDNRTAGNINALNQKYFNIIPHYHPDSHLHPPAPPRMDRYHEQPQFSKSISNLVGTTQKRNPSIFTSLHGSNRRYNPKGSEQQNQAEFFNNTIIYSIQNEVRIDEMQAANRLQAKRNKLKICHSLQLSVKDGYVINDSKKEQIVQQPNLKQSAIHAFSITLNNNESSHMDNTQNYFNQRSNEVQKQPHHITEVYNNNKQEEQISEHIRYTENELYTQQFPETKQSMIQSPNSTPHQHSINQRYNYVPNYSFDMNYQKPINTEQSSNFIERREIEILKTEQSVQHQPQISKQQIHYQSLICTKQQQIKVPQKQPVVKELGSGNNVVLKATIRNSYRVESSLKNMVLPNQNSASASDIISSIQEIRNSEKQLREQLKHFI